MPLMYGYVTDAELNPMANVRVDIELYGPSGPGIELVQLVGIYAIVVLRTDDEGYWEVNLPRNEDIDPPNTVWRALAYINKSVAGVAGTKKALYFLSDVEGNALDYAVAPPYVLPQPIHGLPPGGSAGQAFVKNSGEDYDGGWSDIGTQAEVDAEEARAMVAESLLEDAIEDETFRAEAAEAELEADIDDLLSATDALELGKEDVGVAAGLVATEAASRQATDTTLATAIFVEGNDRAAADLERVLKAGDTMTGPLLLPAGSLGAPSLVFSGDTDTGLRSSGSDRVQVVAGGLEAMLFRRVAGEDWATIGMGGKTDPRNAFIYIGNSADGAPDGTGSEFPMGLKVRLDVNSGQTAMDGIQSSIDFRPGSVGGANSMKAILGAVYVNDTTAGITDDHVGGWFLATVNTNSSRKVWGLHAKAILNAGGAGYTRALIGAEIATENNVAGINPGGPIDTGHVGIGDVAYAIFVKSRAADAGSYRTGLFISAEAGEAPHDYAAWYGERDDNNLPSGTELWSVDASGNLLAVSIGTTAGVDLADLDADLTALEADVAALETDLTDLEDDFNASLLAQDTINDFLAAVATNLDTNQKMIGRGTVPSGAVAATFDMMQTTTATQSVLVSGRIHVCRVFLFAGDPVNSIAFRSGTTAAVGLTNAWFFFADSTRAVQRFTADFAGEGWAASTDKVKALTSQFVAPTSGYYYIGMMLAGTTMPTFRGIDPNSGLTGLPALIPNGSANTGMTTIPALPFSFNAPTAVGATPYGWVL